MKSFLFLEKFERSFVCFLEAIKLNFQRFGSHCIALQAFQLCFIMEQKEAEEKFYDFVSLLSRKFILFLGLHFQFEARLAMKPVCWFSCLYRKFQICWNFYDGNDFCLLSQRTLASINLFALLPESKALIKV